MVLLGGSSTDTACMSCTLGRNSRRIKMATENSSHETSTNGNLQS